MDSVVNLKLLDELWEMFQSSPEGSFERTSRLDIFLAECLKFHMNGVDIKVLVSEFSLLSSVSTIICCELLSDVHRMIQNLRQVNAEVEQRVGEPPITTNNFRHENSALAKELFESFTDGQLLQHRNTLKKSILKGISWKILAVIQILGPEELSCKRQLCGFLIWLCEGLAGDGSDCSTKNPYLQPADEKLPLYDLFQNKVWIREKIVNKKREHENRKTNSKKVQHNRPGTSTQHENGSSDSEHDSELERIGARVSSRVARNPVPEDRPQRQNSARMRQERQAIESYLTEENREIINSEINLYEFHLIAIDILFKLSKNDFVFADIAPDLTISFQTANFSFKQLFAIECENPPIVQCNIDSKNMLQLKCALIELLLVSVDQTIIRDGAGFHFLKTHALPVLLRLLNSANINLEKQNYMSYDEKIFSSTYIFGINYVILIMLYFSLLRRSSLNIIDIVRNDRFFGEIDNGLSFGRSISLIMKIHGQNTNVVECVKKLLILIMRLITLVKRIRAVSEHNKDCQLETHKRCRASLQKLMNHHNSGFGRHFFDPEDRDEDEICFITRFFSIFTYLINDQYFIRNIKLRTKILKCMKSCGTCCCFSPRHLITNSIKLVNSYDDSAKLCFDTLECVLYNQIGFIKLGCGKITQCVMCEKTYKDASKIIQRNCSDRPEIVYSWPYLTHYNELLQKDNSALVHSTMNHILQVSLICNINMKRDLLFNVLYPTFEVAKQSYLKQQKHVARFVTLSCLRLFSNLICSVPTANEFIKYGYLEGVFELMILPEFSKSCCSLLEIAIDVEIFQIQMKFYTNLYDGRFESITIREMIGALPSLNHLITCLKVVTLKLMKCFELEINNPDIFHNIVNFNSDRSNFLFDDMAMPLTEVLNEKLLASLDGRLEILKSSLIYWKTCATLCLYCPMLRQYLAHNTIFIESYKLLKVLLYIIYNIRFPKEESKIMIKIMESLITIGLCLSESTMNQSKDLTVHYLNEALLSDISEIDELNIKLLLEMLIRVSSVYINKVQILPDVVKKKLPTFSISFPDLELNPSSDDEDESKYVCPYLKEDSDQYFTADEGYEADIEICPIDGTVGYRTRNFAAANKKELSDITRLMKRDGILHDSKEVLLLNDVKKNFLVHGEISNLLIDVLMKLIDVIVKKFTADKFDNTSMMLHNLICKCINRLTSIFSIEDNCTIVNELVLRILSNPVSQFLRMKSSSLEELQRSLLNLISAIATHCIMPMELKSYLGLFSYSNIPVKILLEPLSKLSNDIINNVPDFIVCFPIKKSIESVISFPSDEISPSSLEKAHTVTGIISSWSSTSLWCSLEKIEHVLMCGFSAAMWIRLQDFQPVTNSNSDLFQFSSCDESDNDNIPEWKYKRNRYFKSRIHQNHKYYSQPKNMESNVLPNLLHLFSIGQDNIITEFWVDANNGSLQIKNCAPVLNCNKIIGEDTITGLFPLRKWLHFAINVKELMLKQNYALEIELFVNSSLIDTTIIPLEGILHKRHRPTYFLLGHSTSKYNENIKFAGSWCLSEMSLFRYPVLDQHNIIYLMAHGPNKLTLQTCQADKTVLDFTPLFTPELISPDMNWDKIIEISEDDVNSLENNLFFKFSASNPLQAEFHHQTKTKPKKLNSRIPRESKSVTVTIPSSIFCKWLGTPLASRYRGLPVATYLLGGPQMLIYLFARVVELNGDAEDQAAALHVLLKVSFSDMRLHSAFQKEDILSLLLSVFSSPKCLMSFSLLKVMLDASINEPVLVNINSRFHVLTKSSAVVLYPEIIVCLIKAWKDLERDFHIASKTYTLSTTAKMTDEEIDSIWTRPHLFGPRDEIHDIVVDGNKTLLETLLISLKSLLRRDHPNREFNMYQLNKVNLIESLLTSCKERFLHSDFEVMNERAIKDLVDLIRLLIGSPPDFRSITHITDFLVLMHQANLTFITHSRSSFYFLLSPDFYEIEKKTSNMLSLPFMGRKKSKKGSKRRRQGHMIAEHEKAQLVQEDPISDADVVDRNIPVKESISVEQNIIAEVHSTPRQKISAEKKLSSLKEVSFTQISSLEKPDLEPIALLNLPEKSIPATVEVSSFTENSSEKSDPEPHPLKELSEISIPATNEILNQPSVVLKMPILEQKPPVLLDLTEENASSQSGTLPKISSENMVPSEILAQLEQPSTSKQASSFMSSSMKGSSSTHITKKKSISTQEPIKKTSILTEDTFPTKDVTVNETSPFENYFKLKQSTVIKYERIDPNKQLLTGQKVGENSASVVNYETSEWKENLVVVESTEGDRIMSIPATIKEQLRYIFRSPVLRPGCKSTWVICEGLLLLLRDIISVMPDHELHQVLGKIFNHNILLTLCNHQELYVRVGVVKVIAVLVHRHFPENVKRLIDLNYYFHLANQLSLYQASSDLIVACCSLIVGSEVELERIVVALQFAQDEALMRCPPLLGLFSCTFHSSSLFKNIYCIIKKIVERASIKVILEVGLCETILKSLKFLGTTPKKSFPDFDVILKGCQTILADITIKILCSNLNHPMLVDLYNQLLYFELNEKQPLSQEAVELCYIMRETNSYIFNIEIDFISEKLKNYEAQREALHRPLEARVIHDNDSVNVSEPFGVIVGRPEPPQTVVFRASKGELLSRQFATLLKICMFVTTRDLIITASFVEHQLVEKVFSIILNDIFVANRRRVASRWWNSSNDNLQNTFVNLFYWIISPNAFKLDTQIDILTLVCDEQGLKQVLTPTDPVKQKKLSLYLSTLASQINSQKSNTNNLLDQIMQWVLNLELGGDIIITPEIINEVKRLQNLDRIETKKSFNFAQIERSVFIKNSLAISLTESAMSITRAIVEIQNYERKLFLKHLRRQQNLLVIATQKWRDIIDKYCHEMGVWYSKELSPNSWELNPTEGPDRVRIRLRRCGREIGDRFFLKEHLKNKNPCDASKPLSYLFDSIHSCVQGGLVERLHMNENVCFMSRATYITVKHEQNGELLLSDRCIHFLPDAGDDHQSITGAYWPLVDIVHIFTRRWQLKEKAVEVFLSSGHAHLIAFESFREMKAFLYSLDTCHLPNRLQKESLLEIINQWRIGNLSNWAYLMQLNSKAGRTYNDLMQYPVFPFILSDYSSYYLDLTDANTYRDLCKPMAVQNKENEHHYIKNYNDLKDARNEENGMPGFNKEPFHYGSHYSNSGTVLHFLVRLSPFTKLFLNYQDNNFDLPDRTFHSLDTTWRLSSRDSNTDVKELIPEFFYLPQFLWNSEGLNLGTRQCGLAVNDVDLPPWAENARIFILVNRQALESAYVKENLPNWIDLIFGYKQTGQAAVDAINVFHPTSYYEFDPSIIKDQLEKDAWQTMVRTCGQTPRQLLKQPHPKYITDFKHDPVDFVKVLPNVKGLRWGSFCGSPEEPEPILVWRRYNRGVPLHGLLTLKTNEVFGVAGGSTIIPLFERKDNIWKTTLVNLILWGYPDGIIRIKYKDEPPKPLIKIPDLDPLCAVSQGFGETSSTLWLGLQSGRIIVLIASAFNTVVPNITFSRKPINLYGHNTQIVDISVCVPFGVTVSASADGIINIWDLHNFTFIRSIDNKISTVSKVCISQTLGDIATVHLISFDKQNDDDDEDKKPIKRKPSPRFFEIDALTSDSQSVTDNESPTSSKKSKSKYRSKLCVRTINGVFVGHVKIFEKVCSICYSNAPEGTSVNVIAAGLETGSVRLFSSWDLKPLRIITPASPTHPIISMAYSENSQHLYICASDGAILLWENPNGHLKTSAFRVFSPKTLNMVPI